MAFIYIAVTIAGTQSRGVLEASENGGTALAQIAQHYLGSAGLFILAATVTLACLKTAVGLITSCAETFSTLFPTGQSTASGQSFSASCRCCLRTSASAPSSAIRCRC